MVVLIIKTRLTIGNKLWRKANIYLDELVVNIYWVDV
jgi:hypothetical protein